MSSSSQNDIQSRLDAVVPVRASVLVTDREGAAELIGEGVSKLQPFRGEGKYEQPGELAKFNVQVREMLRLLAVGIPVRKIAQAMDVSYNQIRYWMKKPEIQEVLRKDTKYQYDDVAKQMLGEEIDIIERQHQLASEALDKMEHIMKHGASENMQLKAAIRLADGDPATARKSQVTATVRRIEVNADLLRAAVEAAREIA